ncbi:conserved protein of unknown function [Rhodovastum atsumiense]|uniref:DUF4011 domain-containing protein n=1 Tax=Rhodovastum atsumiense TaxID=504468 RepID=UPI00139F2BC4|nr:DUF4011 domain-containing protein [Rhodovastum atsumiense]CAH2601092.1 conserved protein of unknown function [Rhodovastum atsumiense]
MHEAPDRLARWRQRLLDISGRNRLLNLPVGGRQALAITGADPVRIEAMLGQMRGRPAEAPLRFRPRSEPAPDLGVRDLATEADAASLQAVLTEIYRSARAAWQEGGANTLFLTLGALLWRQKSRSEPFRAPILLLPVTLERPSVRAGFTLRPHDDEPRLNATLLELLKQDFGLVFPDLDGELPPGGEGSIDVARVLDSFRGGLRELPGWAVTEEVVLTNLSFTKFLMWKDLAERAAALRQNEVACRLLGGPAGATTAPRPGRPAAPTTDDLVCPLDADGSQLRAVAAAAAGQSFVLIGPPGTGKSQTIANIIADALARGRSVLFVAEKRAALEVVQRRLHRVGLDAFCLDLFSARTSKAAVLERMRQALRAQAAFDPQDWQAAGDAAAALRAELDGYLQALHRRAGNGWTLFEAIGRALQTGTDAVPAPALTWPAAAAQDPDAYRHLREQVEEAAAMRVEVGDVLANTALAGIATAAWTPPWQTQLLQAATTAADSLTTLQAAATEAVRVLGLPAPAASYTLLSALDTLAGVLLDPAAADSLWVLGQGARNGEAALALATTRLLRRQELRAALDASWKPDAMALPLQQLRRRWDATATHNLPRRWLARWALRRRLATATTGRLPRECGADLARLAELQEIAQAIAAAEPTLAASLGALWAGPDTDVVRLEAAAARARRLRRAVAACVADAAELRTLRRTLAGLLRDGAELLAPTGPAGSVLRRLRGAWAEARSALRAVAKLSGSDPTPIIDPARADWAPALAVHLAGWHGAAGLLRPWCAWREVAQRAEAAGLGPLLRALETGDIAPADAVRAFETSYLRWWIGVTVAAAPRLRGFAASRHETRIARFRALDARLLDLAARLARARLVAEVPDAEARARDPDYAVLARELAKRQRHLPVRQLAARMPRLLRRLTPCLMMSPLSVAQYLPADAEPFDLVIFDEASQIPAWDAIGVIGRGRQVVVAGDPQQLPPTRFFERQSPGVAEDVAEFDAQDLDSILDECLGAGLPAIELSWHYRSRHESLIAFSNRTYYGGRLLTFPSPVTRDTAVSFRHVPDGIYDRAGTRTNSTEARAVVAAALALLRERRSGGPVPSLGIVTFNAEQQALIEDLLDAARRDDPALEPHFCDDAPEPVLVKSIEGVQGEERDVMLFSLTYGPDATGRVLMNFGPLNQDGGERRLNVAVTRARQALVVFASLRAGQIDPARSAAPGVAHLRQFLAFAEQGASGDMPASAPPDEPDSLFMLSVAGRLGARGWEVRHRIGLSGLRIDLGVVDPDVPGAFLAGVECDGGAYRRGASARDRDRLRPLVLERLGWRVLRVWATDWWINAEREADRLHAALTQALAEARAARATGTTPGGR